MWVHTRIGGSFTLEIITKCTPAAVPMLAIGLSIQPIPSCRPLVAASHLAEAYVSHPRLHGEEYSVSRR